jgi:hypothetical protein
MAATLRGRRGETRWSRKEETSLGTSTEEGANMRNCCEHLIASTEIPSSSSSENSSRLLQLRSDDAHHRAQDLADDLVRREVTSDVDAPDGPSLWLVRVQAVDVRELTKGALDERLVRKTRRRDDPRETLHAPEVDDRVRIVREGEENIDHRLEERATDERTDVGVDRAEGKGATGSGLGVSVVDDWINEPLDLGVHEGGRREGGESTDGFGSDGAEGEVGVEGSVLQKTRRRERIESAFIPVYCLSSLLDWRQTWSSSFIGFATWAAPIESLAFRLPPLPITTLKLLLIASTEFANTAIFLPKFRSSFGDLAWELIWASRRACESGSCEGKMAAKRSMAASMTPVAEGEGEGRLSSIEMVEVEGEEVVEVTEQSSRGS